MKRFGLVELAALGIILSGCAAPAPSAGTSEPATAAAVQAPAIAKPSTSTAAQAPATGCIGQEIHTCAAAFWRVARVPALGDDLERQLARNARVDVNGRPIGTGMVTLFGDAPQGGNFNVERETDQNNRVASANISLPRSPDTARTAEEYDQSGLYSGVVVLFGNSCVPDKLGLYRTFENEVKANDETLA